MSRTCCREGDGMSCRPAVDTTHLQCISRQVAALKEAKINTREIAEERKLREGYTGEGYSPGVMTDKGIGITLANSFLCKTGPLLIW